MLNYSSVKLSTFELQNFLPKYFGVEAFLYLQGCHVEKI